MTRERDRPPGLSLRDRLTFIAVSVTTFVALGAGVVFVVHRQARARLGEATTAFVEEQHLADRIGQGVVRQLLAASRLAPDGDPEAWADFARGGDEVQRVIQQFLFRPLSTEERRQLETVRNEHQRLEVAAARIAALEGSDGGGPAADAREEMFDHASVLLSMLGDFLALREGGLERLRAQQDTLFDWLFGAIGLVAVLLVLGSLLTGRYLQRRVATPLTALARATARLGEGDLETRVEVPEEHELRVVAESFNAMAASLASAQRDIEGRNRELATALDTVRGTQAELVQAEKMSAVGRMTAGLAHEINNPLASILGHAELLHEEFRRLVPHDEADRGPLGEAVREHLHPLLEDARRARALVANLLRFARKSGEGLGPVALRPALDLVVDLGRHAFEVAGFDLVVGDVPDVRVHAERQRLQDAFLNIVNNALEAMEAEPPDGGRLAIHARVEDGRVRVFFDDDGPGVAEPGRVLEPFYTTKPVGRGTGLGLSLVHRFVRECGGEVRIAGSPSGGARFEVDLPLAGEPERRSTPEPAVDSGRAGGGDVPVPTGPGGARPAVLVVEDEAHLLSLQAKLLEKMGCRPHLAATAAEARAAVEEGDFALVVSDVRMPGESGVDLYRWLQERHPDLAHNFVFVTGDIHNPETADLATERPDMFIQKPFEISEYVDRVRAHLA